jgi:hypothetical protein
MALAAKSRATTKGWLIAEGDSWFDYPGSDVLDWLQQFGYDVESVARAGDRAEMMAFGRGQLDKFAAAVEKVIGRGETPKAILLSAGGNDMACTELGFLLNHAGSPREGFNESIVTGVIDERVADAYLHIIARVTAVCQQMLGSEVPIFLHGYGYVVPDGDGVLGGWAPLPWPWLRPGFIEKGFNNLAGNTASMKKLMNRFNDMLEPVAVAASSFNALVRARSARARRFITSSTSALTACISFRVVALVAISCLLVRRETCTAQFPAHGTRSHSAVIRMFQSCRVAP